MNLVEELLKTDAKKATELQKGTYKSKNLANVLGKGKPVDVTIREIPARRLNEIMSMQFDRNGNHDISKVFDSCALVVAESVIEPNLRDEELMKHFNCKTPKDLAIILFKSEITDMADKISELGGITEDTEEEVKN